MICHIPKTAGTSLRKAMEAYWGEAKLLRDYGPEAATTSPELDRRLQQGLASRDWEALYGHLGIHCYGQRFHPWQVISFVRAPLQQVSSHWAHRVRHQGYAGSLEEFACSQSGIGIHRAYLGDTPLQFYGLIGITDRYAESLALINQCYGLKLVAQNFNVNPNRDRDDKPLPVANLASKWRQCLRQERQLVQLANRILSERQRCAQRFPWVHGAMTNIEQRTISGLAFRSGAESPAIDMDVYRNENRIGAVRTESSPSCALPFRVDALQTSGFCFESPVSLNEGDRIELRVQATGQWLDTKYISAADPTGLAYPP